MFGVTYFNFMFCFIFNRFTIDGYSIFKTKKWIKYQDYMQHMKRNLKKKTEKDSFVTKVILSFLAHFGLTNG